MRKKNLILFAMILVALSSFAYSEIIVGNGGLKGVVIQYQTVPVNYSIISVNNSLHWDSHIWTEVSIWLYNQTTAAIDYVALHYVPYQGATDNVNLSYYNITAGAYKSPGSDSYSRIDENGKQIFVYKP